jgi:Sec-independent protein translocase protein TatA
MLGRELAIILVIALLAAGGSQLPKLVRALGEGSAVPKRQATDDDNDSGADVPGPGHPSPGT